MLRSMLREGCVIPAPQPMDPKLELSISGPSFDRGLEAPDGSDSYLANPASKKIALTMGLSWQQGPLSPGALGRFLVPGPLPKRLLYAERLRRRLRVRFAGTWIADSEDVVLLFEPGHYPMAYFPEGAVA